MKWSIGVKIGGGFALGLAALVALGVISYRNTTELVASADIVTHTYQVIGSLDRLIQSMIDAETGERGYIITGDESFLEPYNAATADAGTILEDLRKLIAVPVQIKNLDALVPLVTAHLAVNAQAVEVRRAKGFTAAQAIVASGIGKRGMDQVRQAVAVMVTEENRLLSERDASSKASAGTTILVIIFGVVSVFVLLIVVALLLIRAISLPLQNMARLADRLAAKDMTVNLPHTKRKDEIGVLQLSLRQMVENVSELLKQTQEGIETLGTSASEILATTTQIASGAAETATGVSETTTTVEEVKQTSQVSSQKARRVMEESQHAVQISQAGMQSTEETLVGMGRIREQMELIAGSIVRLGEQSQAIGEIMATVNDLAEQSNLLAVNAAIEAAKAGDQGRGFSVVAQEVKNLAQQSKQATAQVRGILGDVQKATSVAVMATEQGTKVVEAGVKQSAEVSDAIGKLGESIAQAAQSSTQIAASSQQQEVGMDQIAQAMESIKIATAQNMAGTKQAEAAARQLHQMGESLSRLVSQYKV